MADYPANPSQSWGEAFILNDSDLEFINNLLLEEGAPMESERLAVAVIRERLQSEAKRRAKLSPEDTIYLPRLAYHAGQHLVFPMLSFARGTVTSRSVREKTRKPDRSKWCGSRWTARNASSPPAWKTTGSTPSPWKR